MYSHLYVECLDCGFQSGYSPRESACPACGSKWREARYDYAALSRTLPDRLRERPFDIWRFHELLPVKTPYPPISMGEGGTPLLHAPNLGMMLGMPNLFIKDERQNPTGSFKDRQAVITVASLKESGITETVLASTGNVAIAYSAYTARAGIKLWAFLTSLVPAEKMREVAIYGTQVIKITATYDQTKKLAAEFAEKRKRGAFLDRGATSIPALEAMKTIAFEISEQLTHLLGPPTDGKAPWRVPDWYVQAISGGMGPLGVLKGFEELRAMGLIDRIPAVACIQTEGCAPMVQAWKQNLPQAVAVKSPNTAIATLATGDPGRTYEMLRERMLRNSGGTFEAVSDEEAFRAIHVLAKMEGLSMEPASAVAFAGLIKLLRSGQIRPDETVVVNLTGHTMPVEKIILGEGNVQDIEIPPTQATENTEDGLLAALSRISPKRYSKVLIVDDNAEARRLVRRILQSQGEYAIQEAENGRQALEVARSDPPDVMLLDLMMPEMDGFSVLEALKEDERLAKIDVIVITAKVLTPQEKKRLRGQVSALMQKGQFMDEDLIEEIESLPGNTK